MEIAVLLINCYTQKREEKIVPYRDALRRSASDLGVGLAIREEDDTATASVPFDLAVVTGSPKMAGESEFEPALVEWMRNCTQPLLGICYGHQLLARAFGGTVRYAEREHRGDEEVRLLVPGGIFEGFPAVFSMRESHREVVMRDEALKAVFEETAESPDGGLEGIRHRRRPLFGVQFHPEVSGERGLALFRNFLGMRP